MSDVGVDYGRVRTGFAVCVSGVVLPLDPLLETTWKAIEERLRGIFHSHGIGTVVLGLPLSASGKETDLSHEVRELAGWLGERGFRVRLQNEVLSTVEAGEDAPGKRVRGRLDSLSASVLLKRYLGLP